MTDAALKLKVRNVLGVKQADLVLHGLVLVCGINGAGKSSLLQCTAAAAVGSAAMRGHNTKKAAQALLRNGADAGSIALAYPGGETRIAYPEAQVTNQGVPQVMGTALGIGAVSLLSLHHTERTREMSARLKAEPTKADLTAWLGQRDNPTVQLEDVALLWERIEASGWDAVHASAREHGLKLKGRWEQVTKETWGPKKASVWQHSMLIPGRRYDLTEATAEAKRLGDRATQMSLKIVAAQHNKADLEARAAKLLQAEADMARLSAEADAYNTEGDALAEQKAALPDATDAAQFPECPHCRRAVEITRASPDAPLVLAKAPPALSGQALEELRARRAVVLGKLEALSVDLQRNAAALAEARERLADAQAAKASLDRLKSFSEVSQAEIDAAIEEARDADRKRDAIRATRDAFAIYEEWAVSERMLEALSPDGVRATVMQQRLGGFNKRLGDIVDAVNGAYKAGEADAAGAAFREIAVGDGFDVTYDGRAYALLSESERWRVDLVLAVALGQMEGARLILVDRLDVLHAPARRGVILMLKGLGIPALIGMTAKQVDDAPDLKRFGFGARYWINNGLIEGSA
jgi:hypothetical protein